MNMMSQMMGMMGQMLPKAQEPSNHVSEFLRAEIKKLGVDEGMAEMLERVLVSAANSNEKGTMRALINFYNDIGDFVTAEMRDGGNKE